MPKSIKLNWIILFMPKSIQLYRKRFNPCKRVYYRYKEIQNKIWFTKKVPIFTESDFIHAKEFLNIPKKMFYAKALQNNIGIMPNGIQIYRIRFDSSPIVSRYKRWNTILDKEYLDLQNKMLCLPKSIR